MVLFLLIFSKVSKLLWSDLRFRFKVLGLGSKGLGLGLLRFYQA